MKPLRILAVHPGATVSTHDVFVGLVEALERRGHEVAKYSLDARLEAAGGFLEYVWKKSGGRRGPHPKPTVNDIVYKAGCELTTRALRWQPDRIIVVSGMYLHPDNFVEMRRAHLRVSVLFTESPYDDTQQDRIVPWIDVAWTNERTSADVDKVRYLPHALNAHVHTDAATLQDQDVPSHDVVFVGTGFQERIDTLAAVDWSGIDLGLYGTWDLLGPRHHLRKYIRGGFQPNAKAAALYRRAKIGLNLYRTSKGFGKDAPRISRAESLNPRAYELAATGCFTISDYRKEVEEKFGDVVPTFTTPAELAALVRRWVNDDAGRARVRTVLPDMVTADTWDHRAVQVEHDLHDVGTVAGHAQPQFVESGG
jgi:hypothetical protein